jgi:hypothetical protein
VRKGQRVYVKWQDITAICHSDETLDTEPAESVGWVVRDNKKLIELATTRYKSCDYMDRITIPKGVIESMEVI